MKPKFPSIPYGTAPVRAIAPGWFRELRDFCEWAASHPRGDGETILNTGDGTLRAGSRSGGGGGGAAFPCFRVSLDAQRMLTATGGWLNRNGEMVFVKPPEKGISPSSGFFCVCSTPDAAGKWSTPEFKITPPAADAYPVAEISVDGEAISIVQYPVSVAMILIVKQCPIAEF